MYHQAYVFGLTSQTELTLAGRLETSRSRGRFQYSDTWLNHPSAYALDPVNLPLSPQCYSVHNLKNTFGVFSDAGPDSWGDRIVLQHHRSLPGNEVERLLRLSGMGVGCLQFSLSRTRPKALNETPGIDLIEKLSTITENLLLKHQLSEDELRLLDPGSSMGGARPKVSVTDGETTWLVKFSRPDDFIDVPRVEYASMQLLAKLGFDVPETKLMSLGQGRHAYLIKRFDRIKSQPIHFVSAHSLFNCDRVRPIADAYHDPQSYIALVRHLRAHAFVAEKDCRELYRRMVANVLLGNTDDHGRNHAIIFDICAQQWRLSPVYDMLPIISANREQALGVGSYGRESSVRNLQSASKAFGLNADEAAQCIQTLSEQISTWKEEFSRSGVDAADVQLLSNIVNAPK